MASREFQKDLELEEMIKKESSILLMGSPNVGKSVFFSRLTNIHVVSSNYTGTTVSFMQGDYYIQGEKHKLIDVPGTYSLSATNEAEQIAVEFLDSNPDLVLFVLHAADLEGSIKLLLEVLKRDIPVVAAINLVDVAKRQGREIDISLLEKELGIPIIPTIAIKGEGFDKLEKTIEKGLEVENSKQLKVDPRESMDSLWDRARDLTKKVTFYKEENLSKVDRFGNALLKPWPGLLLGFIILVLSLGFVVFAGEILRGNILEPLVEDVIVPLFERFFGLFNLPETLHNILIGEFGIFRISFEWIIALVMPYVLIFQLVFTFLEDSGILPRLAVLGDSLMSKIGVQGGSLIPVMLGFGCTVPAIISTRTATSKKERLVVTIALCFSIPCISQTGAIISLLGDYSFLLVLGVALVGFLAFIISSLVASKFIPGQVTPMVLEIPYLLIPERTSFWRKYKIRVKQFMFEAQGPMMIAVIFAALLTETGLIEYLSRFLEPVISGWLGLPKEASISLVLGIIRREMSVAPLLSLNLTPLQMFVGAVVSLLYIPCLSVLGILAKEFNARTAIGITLMTVTNALLVGGLIYHLFSLFLA